MRLRNTFTAVVVCLALVSFGYFFLRTGNAQTGVTTIFGKFYRLDVLATNTQLGVTQLLLGPSINDSGVVAFTGTGNLYTADGISAVRNIATSPFFENVQINNNKLVSAYSFQAGSTLLRRFDTNQTPAPATIIAAIVPPTFNDFSNIYSPSSINNSGQPAFSALSGTNPQIVTGVRTTFNTQTLAGSGTFLRPMVADSNVVVRAGGTATSPIRLYSYNLATFTDIATVSPTTFSSLGQSPGISDDGTVVVFSGVVVTDPGTNPNPNYNQTLQTSAGPGIFANFDAGGGTRRTIRIARRQVENFFTTTGNRDGVCDQPEQSGPLTGGQPQCVDGELGLDAAGNPLQFASFNQDARVGVVRQDLAPLGNIEGDVFVVSFIGTPNAASTAPQYFSNQLGLWTVKVEMKREGPALREKPSRPISVIQIGDSIGAGTGNQITGISVYDPIALAATDAAGMARVQRRPDHRVVFRATNQAGQTIIVRGTHIDSDEDGLPDHWETNGIDFNQDGTVDLALNTVLPGDASGLSANPNRKDIYVEMDYMQETGGANPHTHQPGRRPDNSANLTVDPIQRVRNAFNAAPNLNPNGTSGVTLHTFMGEPVPEVFALQFLYQTRPTGAQDDFDDIKFGSNGASPGVPCSNGTNHGYFGTTAERGDATTCPNVLGAKRLVFRYNIFAHRVSFPPTAPDFTSGVAELGGNDFIVSLAVREPISPTNPTGADYEDYINSTLIASYNSTVPVPSPAITFDDIFSDFQAGTFMHELGHTFGLFHGGSDITNCKPNYLSVMSYSRQTNARGIASIPGIAASAFVLSNRRLDYARAPALRTLDEAGLLESAGINGPSGERTLHGRPTSGATLISETGGPIDWSNNGTIEAGAVSVDVNFLPTVDSNQCSNVPSQTLVSPDDWGNLRFNHFEAINFADGSQRRALLDGKDLDLAAILNIGVGSTDVDDDTIANISDNCLLAPNTSQSDSNSNGIGDACDPVTTVLADVSLTMAESADPVQLNTPFDYIATVGNSGPNASQNVNFNYTLPANVTLVSVTPSQGTCSGTSTINCNLGTINSGSNATVTIRVTPTVRGKLDSLINANSGGGSPTADPNVLNNTSSASTTIVDPSQTFTISGRIADSGNVGIAGAFVVYGGSPGGAAQTDGNGNYSFSVPSGGTYTLVPSNFGFNFSPQSRTVAYVNSNQTVNFTGVAATTTAKKADFDGDGRSDLSVFRPSNANWYAWKSSDAGTQITPWGLSTDTLIPGDYDGDGKTDQAVFRPSDSTWYVLQSTTSTLSALQWGLSTDIPVSGDYDGDGKTDFTVWRPGSGDWYVYQSSNQSIAIVNFGQSGDIPLSGDFDGDRKADFAFFRPSTTPDTAMWHVQKSTGGTSVKQYGLFDDKLVPADYDGDGTTDFAIWRPSSGLWYIAPSYAQTPAQEFSITSLGVSGDIPVPGDYDGDGKYDIAMFRNGTWYVIGSGTGSLQISTFGTTSDKPIENAYLPQ